MTIAISIKVNDGIVLATDSAATIFAPSIDGVPSGVINVYQNAEKLFNLCKGEPIGAITWGSGSIGQASISTLIKDYRNLTKNNFEKNKLNNIEEISKHLSDYVYKERYLPIYKEWPQKPNIGFLVAGYSLDEQFAEEWKFDIIKGDLQGPVKVRGQEETGMIWNGEPEAISRLCLGYSQKLVSVLKECKITDELIQQIMKIVQESLAIPFVIAPMPIKDAIDLAEFLVNTTISFSKFSPGAPTVSGPIDIATITKHEGFKWIKRKYYYNRDVNPESRRPDDNYD